MATPNFTEEEIQFRKRARRRLVGAVVLVAVVVAIVPMILPESKPQQDSQPIDIRIPSQDATGYAPKILAAPGAEQASPNVKPAAVPSAALKAAPAAAPGKSSIEPIPAANLTKPSEPEATQVESQAPQAPLIKAATEPAKPAKVTESAKQSYFVQYGAFSEMKNAKQRQADLKARGVITFTEVIKTTAGDKIRVRSGPYAAREQADKVREKVKPLDSKLVVMGNNG